MSKLRLISVPKGQSSGTPSESTRLSRLERKIETMSQIIEDLKREVAEQKTVVDSAVVFIAGIRDQLKAATEAAANGDLSGLDGLAADLDASQQKLAQAIAVNTPAVDGNSAEPSVPPIEAILEPAPTPADAPSEPAPPVDPVQS